jgi:hypothetical protein
MKIITVRLPEILAAQIEAESRERKISKSDVVRERLEKDLSKSPPSALADIIGSVDGLPSDLSTNKKRYLREGYGRKHAR